MIPLRLLGISVSAAIGWLGADQVTTNGPDLLGVAALITAIAGLIGTVGGLAIALRRKPMDATDAALLALAKRLADPEAPDGPQ